MFHYSPSTPGFYDERVHGPRKVALPQSEAEIAAKRKPKLADNPDCRIPADAIPLTEEQYHALIQAQSEGADISVRAGRVVAVPAGTTEEQALIANRRRRARLLQQSDWTQLPDALLDAPDYKAAMGAWRQALRDMDLLKDEFPPQPER